MSDQTTNNEEHATPASNNSAKQANEHHILNFLKLASIMPILGKKDKDVIASTISDYMSEKNNSDASRDISEHERSLITNILKLRDMTVADVMLPRVDIIAIDINSSQEELVKLFAEKQLSRIPVYNDSLDGVAGSIHIKDVLPLLAEGKKFALKDLVREVPVVSPAMPLMDLLLDMRQSGRHMVFVVDEYGGIDGLATVGDVIESIVGELYDEFDNTDEHPEIKQLNETTVLADARVNIEEFEERFGDHFSEEEHEDTDTLGGIVFNIAGRIPSRGEVISHPSGIIFEVVDADPRRIKRLTIKNIKSQNASENN